MRVLFSSTRGTGHLLPLLPYAKALIAKGHEVLVAGPQELRDGVLNAGLEHSPFGHPGDQVLGPVWARMRTVTVEEQPLIFIREVFAGANARAALPGLLETIRAWKPELIVRESAECGAVVAAEVAGVPHVRVAVHHRVMEEKFFSLATEPLDALRSSAGLAPDDGASLRAEAVFTAFPESFEGPERSGFARATYRVGPSKDGPPVPSSGWQPARDGLPLVYITLGTLASGIPEAMKLYQTAVAAIGQLPVRALLTTGRGFNVEALGVLPANLRLEAWVPQAEVFPHAALMVCHGGSGSVLGGLAAGLPQVVLPIGADQPYNAHSIAETGAGLSLPKPDVDSLRAAIQRVLDEPGFRRAARAISAEMATLPSAGDTVDRLVEFAAR